MKQLTFNSEEFIDKFSSQMYEIDICKCYNNGIKTIAIVMEKDNSLFSGSRIDLENQPFKDKYITLVEDSCENMLILKNLIYERVGLSDDTIYLAL